MADRDSIIQSFDVEDSHNNLDEAIEQLLETTERAMNATSRRERIQLQRLRERQQRNVDELMQDFEEVFELTSENLDDVDRQMYEVFLDNRRQDLRVYNTAFNRQMRRQTIETNRFFDNWDDQLEDLTDRLSKVSNIITALNVGEIKNSLEGDITDTVDQLRAIQKSLNLTESDMKDMKGLIKDSASDLSAQYGGMISSADLTTAIYYAVDEIGIRDQQVATDIGNELAVFKAATNMEYDSIEQLVKAMDTYGWDPSVISDTADMMTKLSTQYEVSADALAGAIDQMAGRNERLANGDEATYRQLEENLMKATTMLENSYVDSSKIFDKFDSNIADFTESFAFLNAGGVSTSDMYNYVQSGDYDKAMELFMKGIQGLEESGLYDTNDIVRERINETLDITSVEWERMVKNLNSGYIDSMTTGMESAIESEANGISQAINDATHKKWYQKIADKFGLSGIGMDVTNFIDGLDMDMSDVASTFLMGKEIFGWVKNIRGAGGSGGGGLLSRLFGSGGAGGAGGSGGGLLSGLGSRLSSGASAVGNFFSAGFGGAGANTAAGQLGMNVLGFGAEGGMATLGTGGAMSAGLLATSAMGAGGLAMMGYDAYKGTKKAEEWLGDDSTRSKVESGVGAAVGGTGPGWADEGSVGDKAKNTLAGAGKGALIGGAIGSIIPGLGTAIGAAVGGGIGAVTSAIGGENIAKGIDWIGDKIADAGSWIGDKLKGAGSWIADKASDAWGDFTGQVKENWETTKAVAGKLKDFGKEAWDSVSTWFSDAGDSVGEWFSGAGEKVNSFFDKAGDWFKDKKDKVVEGAKNIKDKAVSGVKKAGSWIADKAGAAWDWISGSHKNGLDYVPYDGYIAELHKGESVLTKEESDNRREGFDFNWKAMLSKIVEGNKYLGSILQGDVSAQNILGSVLVGTQQIRGGISSLAKNLLKKSVGFISGSHKNGLDYVPYDGYIAELHKGESVLTADENRSLSSGRRSYSDDDGNFLQLDEETTNDLIFNAFTSDKLIDQFSDDLLEKFMKSLDRKANVASTLMGGSSGGGFFSKLFGGLFGGSSGASGGAGGSGAGGSSGGTGGTGFTGTPAQTTSGSGSESKIWNFFAGKGLTAAGIAGLMGNLYAESGLRSDNLQNSYESSLGLSDSAYTQGVDSGSYGNFVNDSAGYGLAQWTYHSRKKNLFDYAKSKSKSISDLDMQLEFLYQELSSSYSSVLNTLKSTNSVQAASDKVLYDFEKPASPNSSQRAGYAQSYMSKFGGASYDVGTPWVPNDQLAMVHKGEMIVPEKYNPMGKSRFSSTAKETLEMPKYQSMDALIDVVRQGFQYIGRKIDNIKVQVETTSGNQPVEAMSPSYFTT